jgi:ribonuclease HI
MLSSSCISFQHERLRFMDTTVVLLQKVRRDPKEWIYIVNHQTYRFTASGTLPTFIMEVLHEIRFHHGDKDKTITIVSPALISVIAEDVRVLFPDMVFMPLNQIKIIQSFMNAFDEAGSVQDEGDTLYIGSDASGSPQNTLSAWAWATKDSYSIGVCEFRDNNISELEGILRAIVENRDASAPHLHVDSDSSNAIKVFERIVVGDGSIPLMKNSYLGPLVKKTKQVMKEKTVTVSWVKGHADHHLNTAADHLSRHARKSAQQGRNLKAVQLEADAMFAMFARL